MNSKKVLSLGLSAALVAGLAASMTFSKSASYVKNGKANIALYDGEPDTLDSGLAQYNNDIKILGNTMEGLTRLDGKGHIIKKGVASNWTHSADLKSWSFTLRKDAKWSNGDPVTAKDFVFAWRRAVDPKTAAPYSYQLYYIKNAEKLNTATGKVDLTTLGVKAEGDYKLVVTLEKPTSYFDFIASFVTLYPINEKFYNAHKSTYAKEADQLLYNGPFKIKTWKHKQEIDIVKNTNYWNAKEIKLGGVNFPIITESNTEKMKFFKGQLDTMLVPGMNLPEFKAKGYKLNDFSDGSIWWLKLSEKKAVDGKFVFKNKNIRKAVSYALDRTAYVKSVSRNNSLPATGIVPNSIGVAGLDKDYRDAAGKNAGLTAKAEPKTAKQYLSKGLKELGLKKLPTLEFKFFSSDTNKIAATAIQGMLKQNAGIDVKLIPQESKVQTKSVNEGDYHLAMGGWSPDYNDPMTFLDIYTTSSGNNDIFYSNPAYDKLIEQAKNEADPSKRLQIMIKAEKLFVDDMPLVPIVFRMRTYVTSSRLKGVAWRAVGAETDFYNAYVTK